jgi:hypothetical protein
MIVKDQSNTFYVNPYPGYLTFLVHKEIEIKDF